MVTITPTSSPNLYLLYYYDKGQLKHRYISKLEYLNIK
jgi:hypothetical protein